MGISREKPLEEMERAVSALPGMEVTFSMPIRDNVLGPISQNDGQRVIKVAGEDLAMLLEVISAIEAEIRWGLRRATR
jgi:cobalt-zinc-cadmium resistance protein CzcA